MRASVDCRETVYSSTVWGDLKASWVRAIRFIICRRGYGCVRTARGRCGVPSQNRSLSPPLNRSLSRSSKSGSRSAGIEPGTQSPAAAVCCPGTAWLPLPLPAPAETGSVAATHSRAHTHSVSVSVLALALSVSLPPAGQACLVARALLRGQRPPSPPSWRSHPSPSRREPIEL